MNFFKKLFGFNKQKPAKKLRCHVRDVKPGEIVRIEWKRILGGIGDLKCIDNDPETKKILLEVKWSNYEETGCNEKQQIVLDYEDRELENFHLLNAHLRKKDMLEDESEITSLKNKLEEALTNEEYEKARQLQNEIDKLATGK